MNKENPTTGSSFQQSFVQFVFHENRNRFLLWTGLIGSVVQFMSFKSMYPFPDFFLDSYSYIYAASQHLDINIWPIGYSKFLSVFHSITHSGLALVAFQYFFLELASLYFFFTLLYFHKPGKIFVSVLFIFLFFNPLFLYLGNFVNSDALFVALSLVWITELFWIIHQPRFLQIFIHAILLLAVFSTRNNAYYYPLIGVAAFILSKQASWKKVIGSLLPLAIISGFVIHSRNEAYKLTGVKQYSLFTGWQLANNALYMHDKIQIDSLQLPTAESRELYRYSREFYLKAPIDFHDSLNWYSGNYFICQPESPLFRYVLLRDKESPHELTHTRSGIIAWSKASLVFEKYGLHLIWNHPFAFARYFIFPNSLYYFLPPLEKFNYYNQGSDHIGPIVQNWFAYEDSDVSIESKELQHYLLFYFPFLFLVINLYFIGALTWFLVKKKYLDMNMRFNHVIAITSIFLITNFLFSILVTINVFRYQIFPMIICLTSLLLLIEALSKKEITPAKSSTTKKKRSLSAATIPAPIH